MRHPDFSLKTHNVLIGLWACSALLLGSAPTYAQMTSPTDSSATADAHDAGHNSPNLNRPTIQNSSSSLINPTKSNAANTLNGASGANNVNGINVSNLNSTVSSKIANAPESEEYTDSMIKPTRPQIHMYQPNKETAPGQPLATSLVDVAGTTLNTPLTIVVYFAAPEQVESQDVDSLTGASLVARQDKRQSITGDMADYIGQKLEAPVYKLQPNVVYPQEHEALIERAIDDKKLISAKDFDLKVSLEPEIDLAQVERIFIGFPLWWNDLPLPIYAFLQNTDLSGKTIIPFCTYGNNAPYQLFNIFKELEPNAKIQRGLAIDKHSFVRNTQHKKVDRWLEDMQ